MSSPHSRRTPRTYPPIIALVAIGLLVGLLTFRDFGQSWDEPLFYAYADAVPYAYSISARLSGTFDLTNAYGPSTDHMIYGPAYILLGRPVALLIAGLTHSTEASGWHLINFVTFMVGVVFLYLLASRWMSRIAALGAAALFTTQPLFWGHAFINPKDMPFTVFFILAIYAGYRMVESAVAIDSRVPHSDQAARWTTWAPRLLIISLISLLAALALAFALGDQIDASMQSAVHDFYTSAPGSLRFHIFRYFASGAGTAAEASYVAKAQAMFHRARALLSWMTLIFGVLTMLVVARPRAAWQWARSRRIRVAPLGLLAAGVIVGFVSAIRVIGPLAGVLVALYLLLRHRQAAIGSILVYGLASVTTMYVLWPYLWSAPVASFLEAMRHMADNPAAAGVLFGGTVIPGGNLPASYLPTIMWITLTEPVWPLFAGGIAAALYLSLRSRLDWRGLLPVALWFFVPFLYAIVRRPPLYDGFRHFTFLAPPVFIFIGLALDSLFTVNPFKWLNPLMLALLVTPGILGMARLHPYEYTYYNRFVGGTGGAFRRYETDYWLTCYKDAIEQLNSMEKGQGSLFVLRNPRLAGEYAGAQFEVEPFREDSDNTFPGSYLLLNTRRNEDQGTHTADPTLISVGREGAIFCVIRRVSGELPR